MEQPAGDPAREAVPEQTRQLLNGIARGDSNSADRLLPIVYDELRRIAGVLFRRQDPTLMLQPTALVHEAYLRLVRQPDGSFTDRAHFMAVAARAMKQILIDRSRSAAAAANGGNRRRVPLEDHFKAEAVSAAPDFLVVEDVLTRLAELDPRKARVVEMRLFGGMSIEEVAEALGVSRTTVTKDWRMARAWLGRELEGKGSG